MQEPEVVLTKSSMKTSKMGQPQQRKYSRYGVVGHNVRKCKQKIRQNQPLEDCSSQCMDIFFIAMSWVNIGLVQQIRLAYATNIVITKTYAQREQVQIVV